MIVVMSVTYIALLFGCDFFPFVFLMMACLFATIFSCTLKCQSEIGGSILVILYDVTSLVTLFYSANYHDIYAFGLSFTTVSIVAVFLFDYYDEILKKNAGIQKLSLISFGVLSCIDILAMVGFALCATSTETLVFVSLPLFICGGASLTALGFAYGARN